MRVILVIIFLVSVTPYYAQSIRIGLYDNYSTKSFLFIPKKGGYKLFGDSLVSIHLNVGNNVQCKLEGDSISVRIDKKFAGSFNRVLIQQDSLDSYVELKSLNPSIKAHEFRDNFEMSVSKGKLSLVNDVSLANYLAGVIESEGGSGRHLEYYKVQALISRTYALKNLRRHESEGFNLCDAVHCQAYHNMRKYSITIDQAVEETKSEVFVDSNYNLIGTYFHANCGGQTSDASYVWKNSIKYCEPHIDTFCIDTKQAKWNVSIPRSEWERYLLNKFGLDINNEYIMDQMYSFKQKNRLAFYIHPSFGIPLRDLRQKFRLKSTFFDVSLNNNMVVIDGRGFGHGVGLCQEGAMSMAEMGHNYRQIGLFYFSGIRIMDYNKLLFFSEKVYDELD